MLHCKGVSRSGAGAQKNTPSQNGLDQDGDWGEHREPLPQVSLRSPASLPSSQSPAFHTRRLSSERRNATTSANVPFRLTSHIQPARPPRAQGRRDGTGPR